MAISSLDFISMLPVLSFNLHIYIWGIHFSNIFLTLLHFYGLLTVQNGEVGKLLTCFLIVFEPSLRTADVPEDTALLNDARVLQPSLSAAPETTVI